MKAVLITLVLAASAFAQAQSPALPAACGPENVSFKVSLDDTQHAVKQPEPGKATVYFIQDKGPQSFGIGAVVTGRIGLDGAWVGSNRNNSYFFVSIDPGEHHLCADAHYAYERRVEVAHFTAEAGKVYYFRARASVTPAGLVVSFDPADSDEAKYLIASFPLGVSQPRK
ncbi:MAG: DUF2846 domain-containing protein [Terracidiphilus sp.]|jgi:hypothetical protein